MEATWKRPKTIPSQTEHIETEACGTLHLTLGWQEEDGRLIEVRAVIGKNGICGNVLLDTVAKLFSMYLQSPESRYKIAEKVKRQFIGISCAQGKKSCGELIAEKVLEELSK